MIQRSHHLRLPFRYLEPTFCAGLLDDPLLLLRVRPLGKSLLFDCGQLHHLAKRVLKRVTAIFVSHAHMDHFMGFDTYLRHNHVSPKTTDLFGPPGIAAKVAAKVAGYDWNLIEPYWFSLRVHEVEAERTVSWIFPGNEGFPCRPAGEESHTDRTIYQGDWVTVAAALCDHKIPALAFRATERPAFAIDPTRLGTAGLLPGPWLAELKRRFHAGGEFGSPLRVPRQAVDGTVVEASIDPAELFATLRADLPPASIGYLSDVGYGAETAATLVELLRGVTLLVCECSFLARDKDKARVSHHLCTEDLNDLADRLRPAFVLPMHLSKNYRGMSRLLYEELEMPPETRLLGLPEHITPRPLLASEIPLPEIIKPT